jgi:nicotinate phosphoribosyltransferase
LAAAPVDSYGVGTSVATGSGAPTAGFVYKLVSFEAADGTWKSVAKKSAMKANIGGRKHAVRRIDANGVAAAEVIGSEVVPTSDANDRELIVQLVANGIINEEFVGATATKIAREHHMKAKAELPLQGLRLMRGDAAITTEFV